MKATRLTVREAINDFGVRRKSFGSNRLDRWLSNIRILTIKIIIVKSNLIRRWIVRINGLMNGPVATITLYFHLF
jgi:cytochrome bd-type quinol oxidase subunit 1